MDNQYTVLVHLCALRSLVSIQHIIILCICCAGYIQQFSWSTQLFQSGWKLQDNWKHAWLARLHVATYLGVYSYTSMSMLG